MRNYNTDDFTHLCEPEADLDIWQCNNCGAHADKKEDVKHYPKCVSGDAKKWEKFYEDANEEDNKDNVVQELRVALSESLKLQSHYAHILNMLDSGLRKEFASIEEWIARLKEIKTI